MIKYSFPLLFSFFLALLLNTHSKAQIVYPDKVIFDAQGLSSGTYIYQLKTSDGVLNKKLLLIK